MGGIQSVFVVKLKNIVIFYDIVVGFIVFQKVCGFSHLLIVRKEELLIGVDTVY